MIYLAYIISNHFVRKFFRVIVYFATLTLTNFRRSWAQFLPLPSLSVEFEKLVRVSTLAILMLVRVAEQYQLTVRIRSFLQICRC